MNSTPMSGTAFSENGAQSFNRFLARLAFFALLLPCFYQSSTLFWRIVYPEGYALHLEKNIEASSETDGGGSHARRWLWFEDSAAPVVVKPVRPSKLDATLVGVLSLGNEDNETGVAIIALKGKPQKLFRVGDEVAPATYLKRVRSEFVVLQRDDQEEVLELKKVGLFSRQTKKSSVGTAASAKANYQSIGGKLKQLVKDDMGALIKNIRFKKVERDGQEAGYSVDPRNRKGRRILKEFGIEAKDVLFSANGNDLTTVMENPNKIQELLESRELNIKLERRGIVQEILIK